MFFWFRKFPALALALIAVGTGTALGQPQASAGFESIEVLFAEYVSAEKKRDWEKIFRLGTVKRQGVDVFELVFVSLPMAADEGDLRAILVDHGLEWTELSDYLEDWQKINRKNKGFEDLELQLSIELHALILGRVKDPARLFADLRGYKGGSSALKDLKLEGLSQSGDVATARQSYRYVLNFTTISDDGVRTEGEREVSGSDGPLVFRRVNGKWFFGLTDEALSRLSVRIDDRQEADN